MTLEFLSLHTNDYACLEGTAEHCMYKVRGLRTLLFCIALPARVIVRMQTQEFECHIRPRTYLRVL